MIDWMNVIGFTAGAITMFSFLPQVVKIIKTKSAHDVSIEMALLVNSGSLLWTAYGIMAHSRPVIMANTVNFIFAFTMLVLKLKYR